MSQTSLRIRIEDERDYTAVTETADATQGVTVEAVTEPGAAEPALAPIIAVLVVVGVLAAGKFVVDLMDRIRGGVVIDQSPNAVDNLYRDRDLPYGWVVVKPRDGGEVKIDVKDAPKDMVERLISDFISGGFTTASSVANAAKEALDTENVSVSPDVSGTDK